MAYTDIEQRILDMWPKFEDGTYVWFGDAYSDAECRDKEVEVIESDGRRVYIAGHKGLCTRFIPGERVKRPAVIAADGEPLEVGQMVYVIENGKTHHVTEVDAVSKRFRSMEQVDGSHWLDPTCFTHKRPVLDADGVPLREGDTVWFVGGGEPAEVAYTITADASHPDEVVLKDYEDDWPVNADRLTHTKPEPPDSWERLEEDARELDISLDGENTSDYPRMSCCRDLVRRAKALAEKEAGR